MSSLILDILYYFFGGFMFANFCLIIFQLSSLHPYSNPSIPVIGQSILILISAMIVNSLNDDLDTITEAIRFSLSEGIIGIIAILPFFYFLLIYFMLKASFRKLPFDNLLDES